MRYYVRSTQGLPPRCAYAVPTGRMLACLHWVSSCLSHRWNLSSSSSCEGLRQISSRPSRGRELAKHARSPKPFNNLKGEEGRDRYSLLYYSVHLKPQRFQIEAHFIWVQCHCGEDVTEIPLTTPSPPCWLQLWMSLPQCFLWRPRDCIPGWAPVAEEHITISWDRILIRENGCPVRELISSWFLLSVPLKGTVPMTSHHGSWDERSAQLQGLFSILPLIPRLLPFACCLADS